MSFFNDYEIRARLIPAALIASPLLLPLFAFGLVSAATLFSTTVASAIIVMLIYLFSHVVAFLGRRIEPALWDSWGGPPSLTVLSDADKTFPSATKKAIEKAILDIYGIDLGSTVGETPQWRERTTEAFRLARQYLRQHDRKGVWNVQNAEYAAVRNTLASVWLCAAFSGLSALSCGTAWWIGGNSRSVALTIIAAAIAVIVLIMRSTFLPNISRSIAFRYAESAWLCFLNVAKTGRTAANGGSD
jgi:hypothetical protein